GRRELGILTLVKTRSAQRHSVSSESNWNILQASEILIPLGSLSRRVTQQPMLPRQSWKSWLLFASPGCGIIVGAPSTLITPLRSQDHLGFAKLRGHTRTCCL